jgi:hypothetical protein
VTESVSPDCVASSEAESDEVAVNVEVFDGERDASEVTVVEAL